MESGTFPAQENLAGRSVWTLPEELLQLARDGAGDVVADVIIVFQEDTASRLVNLSNAVRTNNCAQIKAEAHALKGSSSQLGVTEMARMCSEMEQLGISGNLEAAGTLLHRIELHFQEVGKAMSTLRLGD